MLKITHRKLSVFLVTMLVIVIALSGCGNKETGSEGGSDATSDAGPYTYGVNVWGAGVPILDLFGDVAEWSIKVMGDKSVRASDDFTAEKEVQNIQNFVSQGLDGVVFQAQASSSMPQIAKILQDGKMPFVLSTSIGDDADVEDQIANNPYCVGAVDADMVMDGRILGEKALENGAKTAVMIGGNIGDNSMDQRIQGFTEAFEKGGGKILAVARCTDPSQAATKAEDMLSANKDVDVLYALVGDYAPGAYSAIDNLGIKDIMVVASCIDDVTAEYIKDGRILFGHDGISLASYITPTLLRNYLDGNQILDENGKPPFLRVKPFIIDKDNVEAYISVFYEDDSRAFTEEMVNNLIVSNNKDADYKMYTDMIESGLTLNSFLEAHGLPTL